MRTRRVLLAATLAALGIASTGSAQRRPDYIELDALIVEGQIQRPQAVYIIQRANLDFGAEAKRKSFVGKIRETIDQEPF
jgi:hypothetical protein